MEVKNSKVITCQPNGSWEGSYGVMYKFEIIFQNGDVGEYSSKSKDQNKFEVGANAEYEFHGGQYPKIKPHYTQPSQGGNSGVAKFSGGKSDDVQNKIIRQSMLKASVDFHAINPQLKPSEVDVLKTAERFVSFVNGNSDVQLPEEWNKVEKTKTLVANTDKSDLPF